MVCGQRFEVHLLEPDTMSYSAATEDSEKTHGSRENCFFGCEQLSAVRSTPSKKSSFYGYNT